MKSFYAAGVLVFYIRFTSASAFIPASEFGINNNPNCLRINAIISPLPSQQLSALKMAQDNCSSTTKSKSRRLYSYEEARRIARGHGFDSKEEFLDYVCPGAYQIPKDADIVWAESWTGWDDFLGITLSFSEGREVARGLKGIETEESYLKLMKSKTIPDGCISSRLPYRPDLKYKDLWQGWDDFLVG